MPHAELDSLISRFVADVEAIVRKSIAARLQAVLDEIQVVRPSQDLASPSRVIDRSRAPRLCPVPDCGKPAAGPRYRWRCREHGARSPTSPPSQVGSAPAPQLALPRPKTPTIIPADVQITRLPPGPVPKERRTLTGPSVVCRLPGCTSKHSGPRYDLFCREHYAMLNVEERRKYKALWKAHAAA
jgi:hypothetical protein